MNGGVAANQLGTRSISLNTLPPLHKHRWKKGNNRCVFIRMQSMTWSALSAKLHRRFPRACAAFFNHMYPDFPQKLRPHGLGKGEGKEELEGDDGLDEEQ